MASKDPFFLDIAGALDHEVDLGIVFRIMQNVGLVLKSKLKTVWIENVGGPWSLPLLSSMAPD